MQRVWLTPLPKPSRLESTIVYCIEDEDVLILRVVQGRRDIEALIGH